MGQWLSERLGQPFVIDCPEHWPRAEASAISARHSTCAPGEVLRVCELRLASRNCEAETRSMARGLKKWLAVTAAVTGLFASGAGLALGQQQKTDESLAICANPAKDPDASIGACTHLLDQELRESARRRAVALTLRAMAWQSKGDFERAAADFTAAIDVDESFASTYQGRGDLLRRLDQCDLAIPDYDRVIKLAPERAGGAYVGRGFCFVQLKEYDHRL
jgi:tetratricopeptide (TPR) repeat protein